MNNILSYHFFTLYLSAVTPYRVKVKALRAYIVRKRRNTALQDSIKPDSIRTKNITPKPNGQR